jgi:hypothetical protein
MGCWLALVSSQAFLRLQVLQQILHGLKRHKARLSIWLESLGVPYGPQNLSDGGGEGVPYIHNGIVEKTDIIHVASFVSLFFLILSVRYYQYVRQSRENSS